MMFLLVTIQFNLYDALTIIRRREKLHTERLKGEGLLLESKFIDVGLWLKLQNSRRTRNIKISSIF